MTKYAYTADDEIDNMSDYDEIFIGYLRKKMKEVT